MSNYHFLPIGSSRYTLGCCFLVSLPDFIEEQQWVTHGETYQEALENAVEVMGMLVEIYQEKGKPLPEAQTLYDSVA